MTHSIIAYLLTILVLGGFSFFSLRRDGWRRIGGPLLFVAIVSACIFEYAQALGFPRPQWASSVKNMEVVSIIYDEPNAIYLWGFEPGTDEPQALTLPWSKKDAKEAREVQEAA